MDQSKELRGDSTVTKFFSEEVRARIGKPTKILLEELLREEKKRNKHAKESDLVRIAIIRLGIERLGSRAYSIISKGVSLG
jgi:hypothetical protein